MSNKSLKEAFDWFLHIAIAIIAALLIVNFIGRFTFVDGHSMMPTLQDKNALVIEQVTYYFSNPKQGDIVVLDIPEKLSSGKRYVIKRIIATEGQHVNVKDGKVFVDGTELDEQYINGDTTYSGPVNDIVVPDGEIFVIGDNRLPGESRDSRIIGTVEEKKIVGKAVFRFFPLNKIGVIK